MNLNLIEADLPETLLRLIDEIETYCGFEIILEHDPFLRARGMLASGPTSMKLKVKKMPANLAVVVHELCHARRYYNRKIWMMEFLPPRYFRTGGIELSSAENLDNALEHIFILQEMEDEFGLPKDDSSVIEDLDAVEREGDQALRRSILLTTWLLSNYHFPRHIGRVKHLVEKGQLLPTAETLLTEALEAGQSKAKLIAAFVKALDIPATEVRLRQRDPKANGEDLCGMLLDVLEVESTL